MCSSRAKKIQISVWTHYGKKLQTKANDYKEVNHGCSISQSFKFEYYTILILFIKIKSKTRGDYTQSSTTTELQKQRKYIFLYITLNPSKLPGIRNGCCSHTKNLVIIYLRDLWVTETKQKRSHSPRLPSNTVFFHPSRRMTGDMSALVNVKTCLNNSKKY